MRENETTAQGGNSRVPESNRGTTSTTFYDGSRPIDTIKRIFQLLQDSLVDNGVNIDRRRLRNDSRMIALIEALGLGEAKTNAIG